MDIKRKQAFVEKMGKRQKFAKGGPVRRNFAVGGPTQMIGTNGSTQISGPLSPGGTIANVGQSLGVDQNSGLAKGASIIGDLNPLNTQSKFQATGAPIQAGTNADQLNTAYDQTQRGLGMQEDFANQVAQQNGLAHQQQVYNQYQDIAAGRGPNPALAALHQQTNQNVNNQAALMAGQRGAASNVGLMARQNAQQGAATQQQAVGQGATLQANQSLNAIGQAGQIAGNQVNQQGQAITGFNTAAQNSQNNLQNANSALNNANVSMTSNMNNVNGQMAQGNQAAGNSMLSGAMSGFGIMSMLAKGGAVGQDGKKVSAVTIHANGMTHHYDDGGSVEVGMDHPPENTTLAADPVLDTADAPAVNLGGTNYNAPGSVGSPNIGSMAGSDQSAAFAGINGGGGKGGGGGGGGLGMLAMLSDGGEVDLGKSSYQAPAAVSSPNIGSMAGSDQAAPFANMGKEKGDKKKKKDDDKAAPAQPTMQAGDPGQASALSPMYAAKGGCTSCPPGQHTSHVARFLKGGATKAVPAMVSPGERYLSPEAVRQVVEEGANPLKVGEKIGGKAKVKGDSLKNDTVPRTLEEGGIVLPRHVTNKMSREKAELFVHRALARKKAGR